MTRFKANYKRTYYWKWVVQVKNVFCRKMARSEMNRMDQTMFLWRRKYVTLFVYFTQEYWCKWRCFSTKPSLQHEHSITRFACRIITVSIAESFCSSDTARKTQCDMF